MSVFYCRYIFSVHIYIISCYTGPGGSYAWYVVQTVESTHERFLCLSMNEWSSFTATFLQGASGWQLTVTLIETGFCLQMKTGEGEGGTEKVTRAKKKIKENW